MLRGASEAQRRPRSYCHWDRKITYRRICVIAVTILAEQFLVKRPHASVAHQPDDYIKAFIFDPRSERCRMICSALRPATPSAGKRACTTVACFRPAPVMTLPILSDQKATCCGTYRVERLASKSSSFIGSTLSVPRWDPHRNSGTAGRVVPGQGTLLNRLMAWRDLRRADPSHVNAVIGNTTNLPGQRAYRTAT
jgi:hypothetical protein